MPVGSPIQYPWYNIVEGEGLEQGDILFGCPRLKIPALALGESSPQEIKLTVVDSIVLTQSCDLAVRPNGTCEVNDVMLCQFAQKKDLRGDKVFQDENNWDEVRKGRRGHFHILNTCDLNQMTYDYLLIDFHHVYTLSIDVVRDVARKGGKRPRLAPPYREHLSQAFARLFMRVGLPSDLPQFANKKKP